MASSVRQVLRLDSSLLAFIFLLSAALNLGARIPLGLATLTFESPEASIGGFEIFIAAFLILSVVFSRLYLYGGAYLLAGVGITEGLLSPEVIGLARSLHEVMIPFAVLGLALLLIEATWSYRSGAWGLAGNRRRETVLGLQFFLGGLVTFGGVAFALNGTYPFGTALGGVHLIVGVSGLYGGYAFLRNMAVSRRHLLWVDCIILAKSTFSQTDAEINGYLPRGITDSLIGTIIAILVSVIAIIMVSQGK